eukprot:584638-Prymnesium_polylepis.1
MPIFDDGTDELSDRPHPHPKPAVEKRLSSRSPPRHAQPPTSPARASCRGAAADGPPMMQRASCRGAADGASPSRKSVSHAGGPDASPSRPSCRGEHGSPHGSPHGRASCHGSPRRSSVGLGWSRESRDQLSRCGPPVAETERASLLRQRDEQ